MNLPVIRTVTGDVTPEKAGYCQCHEHLLIARGKSAEIDPALCLDDEAKTGAELIRYRRAGGSLIADAQPVGCGRLADGLARLSAETDVFIVASTGFHKLIFYTEDVFLRTWDEDRLTDLFASEITEGMFLDSVNSEGDFSWRGAAKAGIIKTASDGRDLNAADSDGEQAVYRKLFRAAGRAAVQTGAPILTHLEMGRVPKIPTEIFQSVGVPANQILLCHLDRQIDFNRSADYLEVASWGVYLEFDTIGRFKYHSDELEAQLIALLCERGYSDQILLGTDSTAKRLAAYGGEIPLAYIQETFRETLRRFDINDALFDKFTRINPQKALAMRKGIQ